jgi:SAM-dependent methyltransferase
MSASASPRGAVYSEYYNVTGKLPLASRLSYSVRRRMFRLFMDVMAPGEDSAVLDLGVTCDEQSKESNYFEQMYPHLHRVVCAGTEPAAHLEATYPGTRFVQVRPGERLPFADKQFDIVFSNAVIEHAGGAEQQRLFLREVSRVGKRFFITTPNRWFPVELHTGLPFLHFLPPRAYRKLLRWMGQEFYASEANLNLLDRRALLRLFPEGSAVEVARMRLMGVTSNLVAYGTSAA